MHGRMGRQEPATAPREALCARHRFRPPQQGAHATPCVCPCSEVAKDLRCNLCVYDYSGYGESAGAPSVPNTLADISAVFACAAGPAPVLLLGMPRA